MLQHQEARVAIASLRLLLSICFNGDISVAVHELQDNSKHIVLLPWNINIVRIRIMQK